MARRGRLRYPNRRNRSPDYSRELSCTRRSNRSLPNKDSCRLRCPLVLVLVRSLSGDVNDNRPLWAMIGMALAAQAGWRKVGPAVTATMAKVPEAAQSLRDPKTVLHVSSAHRVSDGRIAFKEAPALCAAGYDVTVLGLHSADGKIGRAHV